MRTVIATLIAAWVLAVWAAPAGAANSAHRLKQYKKHARHHGHLAPRRVEDDGDRASGRIEKQMVYDSRTLPFGSGVWWEQMERERATNN